MACQTAIAKRGLAVLIAPVDISHLSTDEIVPFSLHASVPIVSPSDADLDPAAAILNAGDTIAIYGGSGCGSAHDEVIAVAERLKAPIAHTSRAKDILDNPYNVGMTGIIGGACGYHGMTQCDTLLLLGVARDPGAGPLAQL
jgi:pyruvate dehydrogenase (quinone)